jgi:hypothetical protein
MADHDCSSPSGAPTRKPRRVWLRLVLLVSCLLALLGVAGCATNTYNCAPKGCFGGVVLSKANFGLAGTPWAVTSEMYVAPAKCDATCRASSGDPKNPGSISTFVLVGTGQYQIAVGYGTDAFGDPQFSAGSYLPESTSYAGHPLGTTALPQSNNQPYYVRVSIYAVPPRCYLQQQCPPCPSTSTSWEVEIDLPFIDDNNEFITKGADVTDCTAFVPDSLVLGEYLVGKSAGDAYSFFVSNQYSSGPVTSDPFDNLVFHYLTSDGKLSANAGPPYVGWDTLPSKVPGGTFFTECCTPPCDALFC